MDRYSLYSFILELDLFPLRYWKGGCSIGVLCVFFWGGGGLFSWYIMWLISEITVCADANCLVLKKFRLKLLLLGHVGPDLKMTVFINYGWLGFRSYKIVFIQRWSEIRVLTLMNISFLFFILIFISFLFIYFLLVQIPEDIKMWILCFCWAALAKTFYCTRRER